MCDDCKMTTESWSDLDLDAVNRLIDMRGANNIVQNSKTGPVALVRNARRQQIPETDVDNWLEESLDKSGPLEFVKMSREFGIPSVDVNGFMYRVFNVPPLIPLGREFNDIPNVRSPNPKHQLSNDQILNLLLVPNKNTRSNAKPPAASMRTSNTSTRNSKNKTTVALRDVQLVKKARSNAKPPATSMRTSNTSTRNSKNKTTVALHDVQLVLAYVWGLNPVTGEKEPSTNRRVRFDAPDIERIRIQNSLLTELIHLKENPYARLFVNLRVFVFNALARVRSSVLQDSLRKTNKEILLNKTDEEIVNDVLINVSKELAEVDPSTRNLVNMSLRPNDHTPLEIDMSKGKDSWVWMKTKEGLQRPWTSARMYLFCLGITLYGRGDNAIPKIRKKFLPDMTDIAIRNRKISSQVQVSKSKTSLSGPQKLLGGDGSITDAYFVTQEQRFKDAVESVKGDKQTHLIYRALANFQKEIIPVRGVKRGRG